MKISATGDWLANATMVLVAAVMLALTDWRLFLAVAWLGPVLMLCNYIYRRHAGAMWQEVRDALDARAPRAVQLSSR